MSVVKIFASPPEYTLEHVYRHEADEFNIGLEQGAVKALRAGIRIDLALGDFDSVDAAERQFIEAHALQVQTHPADKDATDTELAVNEALQHDPQRILIFGGVGSRLDHVFANLTLLRRGPITLITDHQRAIVLEPGTHTFHHPHAYVSFFAIEPIKNLQLEGFRYGLDGYQLLPGDLLCVSNEGSGTIRFETGVLLVIAADDDQ